MKAEDVNLYLVGFMGTGKSTGGRAVAQRVGFHCIDSDHEIERVAGKDIPKIFAELGEPAFRVMEREFVEGGHPTTRTVIAWATPAMRCASGWQRCPWMRYSQPHPTHAGNTPWPGQFSLYGDTPACASSLALCWLFHSCR